MKNQIQNLTSSMLNNPNSIKFRKTLEYIFDGDPNAVAPLLFIVENYKRYPDMLNWLVKNGIKGKKFIELFQNESPDGGGYHLGATYILSRVKGHKHGIVGIKADELK